MERGVLMVGAGSAEGEAEFDRKKNWSAGGLLERERPLEERGRNLLPMRDVTERLVALLMVCMNESSDGPKDLAMSETGREGPKDCAIREALLSRAGRAIGSIGDSLGEEFVGGRDEVAAPWEGRDGRAEKGKGG